MAERQTSHGERLRGRFVELHLHVDGSLSVPAARRLAALDAANAHETNLATDEELFGRLSVGEGCSDLGEYLDKFSYPLSLVQTAEQIALGVQLLQEELKAEGHAYAELRFAPQSQCARGLTQRQVVEASLAGLAASDFEARLILCCMRGADNLAQNLETVELAAEYAGRGVVALDLAGAEALFPTQAFAPVFARARELGVPFTLHAGEADGPQSVRSALDMGAARIGHGVRAVEDPGLVRELAARRIPLELCLTSEAQTQALPEAERRHVLEALWEAGCVLTINSDNRAVSNTWVGRELEIACVVLCLDDIGARQLLRNAVTASFADASTKGRLLRILESAPIV